MLTFAWPWVFALLLLPLAVAWWFPAAAPVFRTAVRVPFFTRLAAAVPASRGPAWRWRMAGAVCIWLCLVLAAARPQWIGAPAQLPVSGRDILLAVDLSASMEHVDMESQGRMTSRFGVVKQLAGRFVRERVGDRIGLILFGSRAYLHVPLTLDRLTVARLLRETRTMLAGQATAIGDAIGLAIKRLRQRPAESSVLILITDGASNTGVDVLEAAVRAAAVGIRIYPVGVGTDSAGDLDERTLRRVAGITGGKYFRAHDRQELGVIYRQLDQLEPVLVDIVQYRSARDLFHWPLAAAFSLASLLLVMMVRTV